MASYLEKVNEIREGLSEALKSIGVQAEFDVAEPPNPQFGDISTNAAFQAAKAARRPPQELSRDIASALKLRDPEEVAVAVHPSGFINFTLTPPFYTRLLSELLEKRGFGEIGVGKRRVVIEHTSVNPNKALHVGHARNAVIGDVLYRLMRRLGHDVTVLNYIDDTGVQVADMLLGFFRMGFPLSTDMKFDHYCGDVVYVKVEEEVEKNPELLQERSRILKELEEGGAEYERAKGIIEAVVREQLKSVWQLGIRYDLLNWESHFLHYGYWKNMFETLKEKGLIKYETEGKNKGCWVLKGTKVLVRSDGTAVYTAKDITYAAWKLGILDDMFKYCEFAKQPDSTTLYTTCFDGKAGYRYTPADETYILIDQRQEPLQRLVKEVVEALSPGKSYNVLAYGLVSLSGSTASKLGVNAEGKKYVHMSGRSGVYYNLDDLLLELTKAARRTMDERGSRVKDPDATAKAIAVASIRYALVRQDLEKQIVFDIDESLKLEGDTGPYLQYTYVRARKILERTSEEGVPDAARLASEEERALMLELSKLTYSLLDAYRSFSPSRVAGYARRLAVAFNVFYEKHRVLDEQDANVRLARIALVRAFSYAFEDVLNVLGIPLVEEL